MTLFASVPSLSQVQVTACSLHVVLVHSLAGNGWACLLFPSLQSRFWVYGKVSVLKQEQSSLLNEEDCLVLLLGC